MMTPLDIENKRFKKEFSGYSKVEVQEFLNTVGESYEAIYKENLANKDKINMLSNAIKQYKSMEETLQSAILVAQSAGDEVVHNAKKRAENIIAEAETNAANILADANREVTRISYEYEEMKRTVEVFRTRVLSLLTSQLDIVKEFNMPESKANAQVEKIEDAPVTKAEPKISEQANDVLSVLQEIERVTKELPKIAINEKGEYVPAEELEKE